MVADGRSGDAALVKWTRGLAAAQDGRERPARGVRVE
jgi:hypothetical protein